MKKHNTELLKLLMSVYNKGWEDAMLDLSKKLSFNLDPNSSKSKQIEEEFKEVIERNF